MHTRLPHILFSRSSSFVLYGFGATTFVCGLGFSLYNAYSDIYYLWLEYQISRSLEQLEKLEAKSANATRRYRALEEAVRRGDRMIDDLERWDEEKKELDHMMQFGQLPTACAVTDDSDPNFEEWDVLVQRKETKKKMKELVMLDKHLDEEMKWWSTEGQREIKGQPECKDCANITPRLESSDSL